MDEVARTLAGKCPGGDEFRPPGTVYLAGHRDTEPGGQEDDTT